jgi:Flp pilus assembly protein TadG
MKTFSRSHWRERGAAAVEFAIIVPVLFGILFGIIEFGVRFNYRTQLQNATMSAARDISINRDPVSAQTRLINDAGLNGVLAVSRVITVTGVCPAAESPTKNTVTVEVRATRRPLIPYPGFSNNYVVRARAAAVCT